MQPRALMALEAKIDTLFGVTWCAIGGMSASSDRGLLAWVGTLVSACGCVWAVLAALRIRELTRSPW